MNYRTRIILLIALVVIVIALSSAAKSRKKGSRGHKTKHNKSSSRETSRSKLPLKDISNRAGKGRRTTHGKKARRLKTAHSTTASTLTTGQQLADNSTWSQYGASGDVTDSVTTSRAMACEQCVTIQITDGKIRGKVTEVIPGKKISTFLGVQYGEPPIGSQRFKAPVAAKPWREVRDALEYPSTCVQWRDMSFEHYQENFYGTKMWNANTRTSEDCLYLNVWAPQRDVSDNSSLAVMVWIYGGAFYSGTSSLDVYNGKWLAATQRVVVVSMNYRTGVLGFLASRHPEILGNAGMLDQLLALRWVQNNVHFFGGDPKRVTLFGESAGASSISLHMLSPMARGLFSNVILQSASAFSPWTVLPMEEVNRRTIKLADAVGCAKTDLGKNEQPSINMSCLRNVPPQTLVDEEMLDYGTARFPNAPVVDGYYLKDEPSKAIQEADTNSTINVLAGFNLNEGNYFLVYGSRGFDLKNESKLNFAEFKAGVRRALKSKSDLTSDRALEVLTSATRFAYTNGIEPVVSTRTGLPMDEDMIEIPHFPLQGSAPASVYYRNLLDDMIGDINFVCPTIDFLNRLSERDRLTKPAESRGKLYLYNFLHRSSKNPWPEWMGVMHGYEIEFVFGLPLDSQLNYTSLERDLSLAMMERWANFAKFGDPDGREEDTWPTYENPTKYINLIGYQSSPNLQNTSSLFSPRYTHYMSHCAYWSNIFPKIKRNLESILATTNCSNKSQALAPSKSSEQRFGLIALLLSVISSFLLSN